MVVVGEWVVWVTQCFGYSVLYLGHFWLLWPSFPAYLSLLLFVFPGLKHSELWDGTSPSRASGKSSQSRYLLSVYYVPSIMPGTRAVNRQSVLKELRISGTLYSILICFYNSYHPGFRTPCHHWESSYTISILSVPLSVVSHSAWSLSLKSNSDGTDEGWWMEGKKDL